MTDSKQNTNPLLAKSTYKHRAVDFPKIEPQHVLPAIKAAIEEAKANIDAIKANSDAPNFENTIEALEISSEALEHASGVFHNLNSAHTNEELQAIAQELGPMVSKFTSDVNLDSDLFKKVDQVWKQKDSLNLNVEQMTLLENTYVGFVRNGANLEEAQREELREIDQKLSVLSPKFSENVLKETNAFEMVIDNKEDLAGLPSSAVEAAALTAEEKGKKDQWVFTLQAPSLIPLLTYSEKRELREKLWRAYNGRAIDGENSNQTIILDTVKLRQKRAQLLGFKTHADFVLDRRMAESPEKVWKFLKRLTDVSKPAAEKDLQEVADYAKANGGPDEIMPWDYAFYSEKLKQEKFQFSEEDLRPYFPLEQVVQGVFEHANRLYGISFKETSDYPVYHEDVKTYEVYEDETGEFVGLFYADFFPRESKRGGAWMTNYLDQGLLDGEVMRPHVANVCNFTKPTKEKPSLLTMMEVQTLFHEFGHGLHGLLTKCHYRSLSGANVFWDFVELPSQVLENWTLEKEGLAIIAKHYETGEPMPDELIEKVRKSSQFQAGYGSLRQVNFATLDMAWHSKDISAVSDVKSYEEEATKNTSLFGHFEGAMSSPAFSHIFAGGYSAGYYSYKWAEVLDADAFELFKEKGIFNKEVATSFKRNILEKGGTEHPMELYRRFRGREPDPDALLRRDGLI